MLARFLKLAVIGALAATLCDLNHVYTRTLRYPHPTWLGQPWWVFFGFVIGFLVMAAAYVGVTRALGGRVAVAESTASGTAERFVETLLAFVAIYLMSGFGNFEPGLLAAIFSGMFFIRWAASYERGFMLVLALALAIGGMAGEGLMSAAGLVHYRAPEVFYVPFWLGGVYAHGAFALREGMRFFVYTDDAAAPASNLA